MRRRAVVDREPSREEIRVPGVPEPTGVGTYVVRAGDLIFVQGFTAQGEDGRALGVNDAAAQAGDREAVYRVRREYFGSTRPASTEVEVSRLVNDDLLVEIDVIEVRPSSVS